MALSRYQAEQAPDDLDVVAVIGNPIVVGDFPFREEKGDYLLWIGRLNDDKGPQRAIAAAREAEVPLVLAGPVQPGQEEFFAREVEPHMDGDAIRYIGEVGDEKGELYAGARALLMPIRWPEPFGLVMTEAMACGTPVIAFPEGSAPEIVLDGETGFVVEGRARDGGRDRAARGDRPGALPRERGGALRRDARGRGVRARIPSAWRASTLTHSLTCASNRGILPAPPRSSNGLSELPKLPTDRLQPGTGDEQRGVPALPREARQGE